MENTQNSLRKGEDVRVAKEIRTTIIPVLNLLVKDQIFDDEQGRPASRPKCGASS